MKFPRNSKLAKWIFSLFALGLGLSAFGMSNADVIAMVAAGLGNDVILAAVTGSVEKKFDTSVDGLVALKNAKVPDGVIAAMVSVGSTPAAPKKDEALAPGCYFVHAGTRSRADALSAPEIRVGGKAFIPFANLGNVPVYAWFDGAAASRTIERGDQIIVVGWDVRPQLVKFFLKDGRRYSTLTKHGKIIEESVVKNCDFTRDSDNHWVATLPKEFAAGEYWVMVPLQGHETPAFDFGVR